MKQSCTKKEKNRKQTINKNRGKNQNFKNKQHLKIRIKKLNFFNR
jgi:hypothetical protein